MYPGLYSAASGMIAQGANQDIIAQNLANVSVHGHKKERMVFRSFPNILLQQLPPGETSPSGSAPSATLPMTGGGTGIHWVYTDFSPGQIHYTTVDSDFALFGDGFFEIQSPDGQTFYTRNGAFIRDGEGYLRTREGDYVMGEAGPIQLTGANFEVDRDGNIYRVRQGAPGAGGAQRTLLDRLRLTDFTNRDLLRPISGSRFILEAADPAAVTFEATDPLVGQGYLESSNASSINEMVHLLDTYRNFEANSRVARAFDETTTRAIDMVLRTV